ncbi:hypothetical protein Noc_0165 [Nitrosococcus oceani ATCC 19707]|uniref:Uncharacterized protein n=2 Tax=Nitrosococcus oceani TaxID=1229 RepID=Q3JEP8_NITOC|nr:hypothetical protein [Nitrosococcus oceani]ABA56698.1 hypothetical protein Noc_0165 [Nitrosococcus oceani ATCC 19707]EDZ66346.1 hypothetical protein NOC27_3026 [Nitrosococcus oceani AFC27]KFI20943.1 hypothetical protein IB75_00800 [Nitrosococcus oceani C-27]GEM20731.1 hypothetical protein NONS58_21510 [Nitrosococcus oceani]
MTKDRSDNEDKRTLVEQLVSVERISFNVTQSVIVTTEDKIRLSLSSYLQNAKRRSDWIAPASLLIAILATLVTATFNDFILSGATWKAVFIIVGLGAAIWLIRALLFLRDKSTIEELIEEIKTGNRNEESQSSGGSI